MKSSRWLWWLAAAAISAAIFLLVVRNGRSGAMEQRLARYRAAGQPTTLVELDAWYPAVPPEENAAPLLLEAFGRWRSVANKNLATASTTRPYPPRGEPWTTPVIDAARAELWVNAEPLAAIHAALTRPRSRYPGDLAVPDGTSASLRGALPAALPSILPHQRALRYLGLEARFAAETGDPSRAASALLASLRAARTLEDEPLLIAHMTRITWNGIAMEAAEDVLSRTSLAGTDLVMLQKAFAEAGSPGHLGRALVGERCMVLDEYRTSADKTGGINATPSAPAGTTGHMVQKAVIDTVVWFYRASGARRRDLVHCLDQLDLLIETAALPPMEIPARQRRFRIELDRLDAPQRALYWFSRSRLPFMENSLASGLRSVATLRCAQAAMAVERWRLGHAGLLPPGLEVLVPELLAAVPIDPMDGKPVKFRPLAKGYVVYSIGEDGHDDGGKERAFGQATGFDYTFTVAR